MVYFVASLLNISSISKDFKLHRLFRLNFILLVLLFSCGDAPRNNPLDPQNPKFNPLPQAPKIDSLFFYSIVILRAQNDLNLKIIVYIDDTNNPVDYLSVTSTLNIDTVRLNYFAGEEKYEYTFTKAQLGVNIPDLIIGHRFDLFAIDRLNNTILMRQLEIKRIIKEEVSLVSPGVRDSVESRPTLTWQSDFDGQSPEQKDELEKIYHFKVEILNENLEIVWSKDFLSIKEKEIIVDNDLLKGEYNWAVWIIDNYRNRKRTQLRKFIVK
jgi:hypothetical protein